MASSASNSTISPNINKNTGKITLKIENVNSSEWHQSSPSNIGGFKWHLKMRRVPNKDVDLIWSMHISCSLNNDNASTATVEKLWLCKAQVQIRVLPLNDRGLWRPSAEQFHFFNEHTCRQWTTTVHPMFGRTPSEVEMEVTVKSYDSSMPTLDTDLQMLYNGREECVAVSKHTLASFSSYFRNLFFGNWSERVGNVDKDKFDIKEDDDFDLSAFKLMLNAAMAMGSLVEEGHFLTAQTALPVLKLAIKYDVPMLRDNCQEYLMKCYTDFPKIDLLEVAEQLGLLELKDHCLTTVTPIDMAENFVHNNEIFGRLSKRTQQALAERLDESAKKMRQAGEHLSAYDFNARDGVFPAYGGRGGGIGRGGGNDAFMGRGGGRGRGGGENNGNGYVGRGGAFGGIRAGRGGNDLGFGFVGVGRGGLGAGNNDRGGVELGDHVGIGLDLGGPIGRGGGLGRGGAIGRGRGGGGGNIAGRGGGRFGGPPNAFGGNEEEEGEEWYGGAFDDAW